MNKGKITAIIIAICLILGGAIISAIALINVNFDFSTFNTVKTENNTYEITETFSGIDIESAECDIKLLPATDGVCKVICSESDKISHEVAVENGTLTVKRYDNREWYEHIGIYWGEIKITVFLPNSEYQELYLRTLSGDISLPSDFTFYNSEIHNTSGSIDYRANTTNNLKLKTVSGDIRVFDNNINVLNCDTTSGDIELLNVVAINDFTVQTVSGDIEFKNCEGSRISLKATSGDIEGSLLSSKKFVVETTSGDIDVPPSITDGGECQVKTTSGDIEIEINQ